MKQQSSKELNAEIFALITEAKQTERKKTIQSPFNRNFRKNLSRAVRRSWNLSYRLRETLYGPHVMFLRSHPSLIWSTKKSFIKKEQKQKANSRAKHSTFLYDFSRKWNLTHLVLGKNPSGKKPLQCNICNVSQLLYNYCLWK